MDRLRRFIKLCYKTHVFAHKTCRLGKSPYLCTVFFIVLDFKVNKGWSTAVLLFLCPYVKSYFHCLKTTVHFTLNDLSFYEK